MVCEDVACFFSSLCLWSICSIQENGNSSEWLMQKACLVPWAWDVSSDFGVLPYLIGVILSFGVTSEFGKQFLIWIYLDWFGTSSHSVTACYVLSLPTSGRQRQNSNVTLASMRNTSLIIDSEPSKGRLRSCRIYGCQYPVPQLLTSIHFHFPFIPSSVLFHDIYFFFRNIRKHDENSDYVC